MFALHNNPWCWHLHESKNLASSLPKFSELKRLALVNRASKQSVFYFQNNVEMKGLDFGKKKN